MGHALKRTTAHEIAFALPLISGESVNLSEGVAPSARLQNRTCTFQRIRLLNGLAVVISTSDEAWEMCFESLNICAESEVFHPYIGYKPCS